jgi:hypothetical protein
MKTWVRKTLSVGVLAAGALLFAPGAAHADTHQNTYDNNGILNGTQLVAPISIPLNIVGNAIGVAGEANAAGAGGNHWTEGGHASQSSWDNNGIGNGTQVYLPINVPVNVVGNAVGVLGEANAAGAGVNGRKTESAHTNDAHRPGQNSWDNNGILNGTQIYAPIDIPINICGNSLALLGEANSQAVCRNDVGGRHGTESGWAANQNSTDNNGILNGTQLYAPISLPVNLAGNSVSVLGESNAAAQAINESGHGDGVKQNSSDGNGILNGTQIAAPINVPINLCGNALSLLGEANASAACAAGVDGVGGDNGHGHGHHGNGGANGQGNDNGGVNGNDGDYLGDHGQHHGNGNGGVNGNGYGDGGVNGDTSTSSSTGGRAKSATEASAVDALTQGAGGLGSAGLGGFDLLSTLR